VHHPVQDERDQGAEPGVAVHELPGAVDGVDDPDRRRAADRLVGRGIGVHRLLADHDRAGQQRGERAGEVPLGQAVGVRHEVVRSGLLVDLVRGEPPEPGHDLGGCRRADGVFHVGRAAREKLVDGFGGFGGFDHGSMTARPTDNPCPSGVPRVESP
jgi:hypothetical protein